MRIGFDNDKYISLQAEKIRKRIGQFGGKLYLEFGGKLFDDYHASRVLPGFEPDSKMKMLLQVKDQAEIVIAICAEHIELNKRRGDLGITYDMDVMRLIDAFRSIGLYVGSVVITQYRGQHAAELFQHKLENLGVRVYKHYPIADYPSNIPLIVSDDGYGKNDYIETSRPVVVVTAPGPGSGKMATFTGVRMPSRFGSVKTDENGNILSWQEKPVLDEYINCGFFVFKREFLDYLSEDESCDLEKEPLERLAAEGQLSMYRHTGFWQCMDTLRDAQALNSLWDKGNAPWCK